MSSLDKLSQEIDKQFNSAINNIKEQSAANLGKQVNNSAPSYQASLAGTAQSKGGPGQGIV